MPPLTRPTSTATTPETTAPRVGTKAPKKMSAASGTGSGMPISQSPTPAVIASAAATRIVARV